MIVHLLLAHVLFKCRKESTINVTNFVNAVNNYLTDDVVSMRKCKKHY